jgi:hypothetical protein
MRPDQSELASISTLHDAANLNNQCSVRSRLNSEPTTKTQINEAPIANALVMNRNA